MKVTLFPGNVAAVNVTHVKRVAFTERHSALHNCPVVKHNHGRKIELGFLDSIRPDPTRGSTRYQLWVCIFCNPEIMLSSAEDELTWA
jgi:hypothetical protein